LEELEQKRPTAKKAASTFQVHDLDKSLLLFLFAILDDINPNLAPKTDTLLGCIKPTFTPKRSP
jgi:hypothetical protein